jgi:7-carboxy-7-deazaguanine synthase
MNFKVAEIFSSINGEGRRAGELAVFVRFCGCNLACSYCDTTWANEANAPFTLMSAEEIYSAIKKTGIVNVTLTGGEPLLQPGIKTLLQLLATDQNLRVEIETNGSMPIAPYDHMAGRPSMTLDYKLPGSGMEAQMCFENYAHLQPSDTVKFVCGSNADLNRALEIIRQFHLTDKCAVYFSPVFGQIDPAEMVEFLKTHVLNDVRLQLQLHKFIWDPAARGV